MFIVFNLSFPLLNFLSFTLITLPVCLPKQFFSINGVYSPQISTDYFHICPHTVLCFRQTLFSFMNFALEVDHSALLLRLWLYSGLCHPTDTVVSGPLEAVKAARMTRMVNTLAHSQRRSFQPVLDFKHTSNPTCFTEITHALKIKPCSAAVLEWDWRVLFILHRAQ